MRAFSYVLILVVSSTSLLLAQDTTTGSKDGSRYGEEARQKMGPQYSASMGSVTVQDRQLYRLSLRPEIPFGKLAVAFDIELFIGEDGDFQSRGWSFDTAAETFDTFLRKIYYVRYGRPGDPVFVRVGALDRVTLGYGLIMDRYRNTLQYPGVKNTGVRFQLEGLGGGSFGVEGLVSNLQDLEEGGALVGLRVFNRPMPRLEVGLTYVVDLDQYAGLLDRDGDGFPDDVDAFPEDEDLALDNDGDGVSDDFDADDDNDGVIDIDSGSGLPPDVIDGLAALEGDAFRVDRDVRRRTPFDKNRVGSDPFGILGLDAGYNVLDDDRLNLTIYGQMAVMIDDDDELSPASADSQGVAPGNRKAEGFGVMAPGLWAKVGPFDGRLEYRFFQDDFEAGYFDNLYDVDRARLDVATGRAQPKDASLGRGESLNGVYGRLVTDLFGLARGAADYQHMVGADEPLRQLHAEADLSPQLLTMVPRLKRASAYYQKNNIGNRLDVDGTPDSEDGFFESTEDTFYGYDVGFEMAGGVAVVWDTRFLFVRAADGRLDRRKVMSIETVFSF
ncbi:MAG TPA: hypothetical protein QGF95_06465 [Candidatus Latescibacteria bacterium]|jgi:hypothetical protein|nr:hypothetical protein [Gemmatimonadaceae bacterium]HJP30179.1 hypothetical protein [Candidatus Latescibacterota bacterium]